MAQRGSKRTTEKEQQQKEEMQSNPEVITLVQQQKMTLTPQLSRRAGNRQSERQSNPLPVNFLTLISVTQKEDERT
jgi:hypothetical protein